MTSLVATPPVHRFTWLALAGIMLLGLCLRLYGLTNGGLWLDELHSMNGADPSKTWSDVYEYSKTDQPPLLFFLLHGWLQIFEYNDFYGRLLTTTIGVLGIGSIFFAGREFSGNRVGLIAAAITAINYFHIDFSREIRFYPLVFLLSSLSYLFFLRCIKDSKVLNFIAYGIFTSLLLNTHYFGMIVFVTQFIVFAILIATSPLYRRGDFILKGLGFGTLIGLSFYHWLPVIFSDLALTEFHVQPPLWYFPIQYVWVYFKDIVTCLIVAVFLIVFIKNYIDQARREKGIPLNNSILLAWVGIGFLIPLIYSIVRMPLLTFKYSVIVLPGLFLIFAKGISYVRSTKFVVAIFIAMLCAFYINSMYIKPLYNKSSEYWREVASYIIKENFQNEVVFSKYAWYNDYYFKTLHYQQKPPVDHRHCDFTGEIRNAKAVWLLVHLRYPDQEFSAEQQVLIDKDFVLSKKVDFNEAYAKLYVRK